MSRCPARCPLFGPDTMRLDSQVQRDRTAQQFRQIRRNDRQLCQRIKRIQPHHSRPSSPSVRLDPRMLSNPQEQCADLGGKRGGCRDSQAEREDLKYCGTDACHEDDREEFVAEFRAGGQIDGPVAAVNQVIRKYQVVKRQ